MHSFKLLLGYSFLPTYDVHGSLTDAKFAVAHRVDFIVSLYQQEFYTIEVRMEICERALREISIMTETSPHQIELFNMVEGYLLNIIMNEELQIPEYVLKKFTIIKKK